MTTPHASARAARAFVQVWGKAAKCEGKGAPPGGGGGGGGGGALCPRGENPHVPRAAVLRPDQSSAATLRS